ncbi:MAG TPA: hypothetical protein VF263_09510 [Longimicrobiaceae bacterium]
MADTGEAGVRRRVREIALRLAPESGERGDGDGTLHLIGELGYHSLALLELAFALEGEFGLAPIPARTAGAMHTTADLEEYVLGALREAGRPG